jgi:hypothetical protein
LLELSAAAGYAALSERACGWLPRADGRCPRARRARPAPSDPVSHAGCGTQDLITPPLLSEERARRIPVAHLRTLPNSATALSGRPIEWPEIGKIVQIPEVGGLHIAISAVRRSPAPSGRFSAPPTRTPLSSLATALLSVADTITYWSSRGRVQEAWFRLVRADMSGVHWRRRGGQSITCAAG